MLVVTGSNLVWILYLKTCQEMSRETNHHYHYQFYVLLQLHIFIFFKYRTRANSIRTQTVAAGDFYAAIFSIWIDDLLYRQVANLSYFTAKSNIGRTMSYIHFRTPNKLFYPSLAQMGQFAVIWVMSFQDRLTSN